MTLISADAPLASHDCEHGEPLHLIEIELQYVLVDGCKYSIESLPFCPLLIE